MFHARVFDQIVSCPCQRLAFLVHQRTRPYLAAPGTQVVSLNAFGGGLRQTCAAAFQGAVNVYDAPGLFAPPGAGPGGLPPKGFWRAHDNAAITALTTSTAGGARVATGARDGTVVV